MKTIFLTFVSAFLLLSCSNDDNNAPEDFEPVNIEFTTIGKRSLGGNALNGQMNVPPQNIVISDEVSWENFIDFIDSTNPYPSVVGNISDDFSTTDIDFENFQLIVVIDEVRWEVSGITITSVIEYQDNIVVTYALSSTTLQADSQPFHIVQIPKSDKPVVFEVE